MKENIKQRIAYSKAFRNIDKYCHFLIMIKCHLYLSI
jgi:hypothetical protein